MSDDLPATVEPDIEPDSTVRVQSNAPNTLVDPFDPVDVDFSRWFSSPTFAVTTGNEIIPYIFGEKLFTDLIAAFGFAKSSDHFIYILAWSLENFELVEGDSSTLLSTLLEDAANRGVQVRAMLFKQHPKFASKDNAPMAAFIDALPGGKAIHDDRLLHIQDPLMSIAASALFGGSVVGAHHQKVIVTFGEKGLIAFQGGIDPDANRRGAGALHDVHTRVRGPAAFFLYRTFIQRWKDHPDAAGTAVNEGIGQNTALNVRRSVVAAVTRTFGNGTRHPGIPGGYAFAKSGEQTVVGQIKKAVSLAKRFIYIEDQYLVSMDVSNALKAAAANVQKIILLICPTGSVNNELFQTDSRRKAFLDNIGTFNTPGGKLWVCTSNTFIHAKVVIVDDKLAIIGSANSNRRGYTHDSEQALTVFDVNKSKRWFWAHELRMNLWKKHLGGRPIDYVDPIAAAVHWETPRGTALPFVPDPATNDLPPPAFVDKDAFWDFIIDPDGS